MFGTRCHRGAKYSSAQFLSIFKLLQGVLDKFKIVEKLVFMSDEQHLKDILKFKNFVVHLDQTVLHVKPIHNLTKALQGPSLTVHDQLSLILTVASQLLQRLYKKNSGGVVVPMVFSPVNNKLFCSNVPIVQSALYSLEKHVEQSIIVSRNKQFALQIQVLLKRFQPFLVSPLTKNCHILAHEVR